MRVFCFILTFCSPVFLIPDAQGIENLCARCMSASGNDDVTPIGKPFHRAQLKINGGDSRRYLNRIFSRTGSTRTVLPVFGCNFSLATGRRWVEGRGGSWFIA